MEKSDPPPTDTDTARELARIEYEPMLPAEQWLVGCSLALGVLLLGVFVWVSRTYFPAAP